MTTADRIVAECDAVKQILLEKNRAYGDSALNPVRIFSSAATTEQLRVRLDDKLSRLARGHAAGEDVTLDLLGYLILLRIAERLEIERASHVLDGAANVAAIGEMAVVVSS